MKQSIFEIDKKYTDLLSIIEESDGEITEETSKQLDITINDVEEKFFNYAYIIKKLESECKIIDDEIERLNKLKSIKSNSIKSLEKIVLIFLPKYGNRVKAGQGHKYVFDLGKIKLENRYTKPVVIDEELKQDLENLIMYIVDQNQEMVKEILGKEGYDIIEENLDKYISTSYELKPMTIQEMKDMLIELNDTGFHVTYSDVKVKINANEIKNDLKLNIEIPGARIDLQHSKLNIK